MIGQTISHNKVLEKLGEGGPTTPLRGFVGQGLSAEATSSIH